MTINRTIAVAGQPAVRKAFALTGTGKIPPQLLRASLTYTDYTPVWTSNGTAPAIGNGTAQGRYLKIGTLVHYVGSVTFGSTSTFGTGVYFFSLPVTRATNEINRVNGVIDGVDSSASARLLGIAETTTSASTFSMVYAATWLGTQTNVGQTSPWTWATSDMISWNLIYESA